MSEHTLQNRLKRLGILAAVVSAVILVSGSLASRYLRNILKEALTEQMKSDADQYKIRILRQIEADIQILETLGGVLQYSDADPASFVRNFQESPASAHFESIEYLSGPELEPGAVNENVSRLLEEVRDGKSGVSRIYREGETGESRFACAVPVYLDRMPVGAVIAYSDTDVFLDILEDDSILGSERNIHLISDSGRILVRSDNRIVNEDLNTIYDNGYILPEEKGKIERALAEGEECLSSFTYGGGVYQMLIEPVGVNGWYLFSVRTTQGVSQKIYSLMTNTRFITGGVLLFLLFIIAYGYRVIFQGNVRLIRNTYYDPLTGAYNRARFEYETGPVIRKSAEYSLAALNIRHFKYINEIFGKRAADELLCFITKILGENIGSGEYYCRSSEDLFYIFMNDHKRRTVRERLEKIIQEIGAYRFGAHRDYEIRMYCGVMIGTEVPDGEPDVQKSMTHVRFALDTAGVSPKTNIWFYDAKLHERELLENYVESHMNQALEDREFRMVLQPKIDLESGGVKGAEALVRWVTGTGEVLSPARFIPIFENNGFCSSLDMYMAEQACRQIREWIDSGYRPVPLSVNQSRLLFYETDYIDRMNALLDRYDIPGGMITLEILEGLEAENTDEMNTKILRLKELGFRISMDDFGSGYSSLNALAGLKIDELKFDRGFLSGLKGADADRGRQIVIMREVVDLAKKLGLKTVMEGIETKEQEELARSFGCECGQGYYYSGPVGIKEFSAKFLHRNTA